MEVNIIARSIDGFKEIETELSKLPEEITNQIISAQMKLIGLECKVSPSNSGILILPKNTSSIKKYGEHIGIHCEPYYFVLGSEFCDNNINYVFIDCNR